ncbi:hypothetical protein RUND412_010294, partial [Rhizina undulata]
KFPIGEARSLQEAVIPISLRPTRSHIRARPQATQTPSPSNRRPRHVLARIWVCAALLTTNVVRCLLHVVARAAVMGTIRGVVEPFVARRIIRIVARMGTVILALDSEVE